MYLRSLATAARSEGAIGAIGEVRHGQKHTYYLALLGLNVENKESQPLALDDGDIDFPAPKRGRDAPPVEDGDVEEPDMEDDDVEQALLDLDFEEALAAELEMLDAVDVQECLDEHVEDRDEGDGDAGNDEGRELAVSNPSSFNHKWGPY